MSKHLNYLVGFILISGISYAGENLEKSTPFKFRTQASIRSLIEKYGTIHTITGAYGELHSHGYCSPIFKVEKNNQEAYYAANLQRPGYLFYIGNNQALAHTLLIAFHSKK